jgi:hypothetical protein
VAVAVGVAVAVAVAVGVTVGLAVGVSVGVELDGAVVSVVLVDAVVELAGRVVLVVGEGVTHGSTVGVGSGDCPEAAPPAKELMSRATRASAATSETWIHPDRCCWSAIWPAPSRSCDVAAGQTRPEGC